MHAKKMITRGLLLAGVLAGAVLGRVTEVVAQGAFPERPVRVVVPFAAGGGVDVIARMVGEKLGRDWGQSVVVDNKPGAGTLIAAQSVATSPADGYVLLAATADTLSVTATLQSQPIVQPHETLAPITQIVRTPLFITVREDSPYKTLDDFVRAARQNPATMGYATAGIGTIHHMAMELFNIQAGIETVHIAYRGSAPAMASLLSGVVPVGMIDSPVVLPQLRAGKVRVLAVSTSTRTQTAPDVPTIAELGYAGFAAESWMGFAAPRNTPAAVMDTLFASITSAIHHPEVAQRLRDMGLEPTTSESAAQFARFAEEQRLRWAEVIRAKNISLD